ncbi:MAG: hypothetical protein KKG59_04210 [Nanoarchaeota archaeon]|nr:hypothetical protein [Nanoarchaeota archaeon]
MSTILDRILELLKQNNISFEHMKHEHVHRSEEAAKIRGTRYEEAAKALVLFGDSGFVMAVVPGPQRMDYKLLKKELGIKKLCLATPEQVQEKTGLTIGSVPPFGNFWDVPMYIEESLLQTEFMTFSAGTHHDSVRLKVEDYLKCVPHKVVAFRKN